MFGEVPDSPEVVLPPSARRLLGRKALVSGTVMPPPPRYVEYTNWFVPLKLGSSFIKKVSVVPWKVVWKPFRLAGNTAEIGRGDGRPGGNDLPRGVFPGCAVVALLDAA